MARDVRDERAGVVRVTKALLPALEGAERAHRRDRIDRGRRGLSRRRRIHRREARRQRALQDLRLELLGKPIRVTEVAPGLVETEFSLVRFEGDEEKASKVYEGLEPLTAEDVAETIAFWSRARAT